jgi:hypothetical protein
MKNESWLGCGHDSGGVLLFHAIRTREFLTHSNQNVYELLQQIY